MESVDSDPRADQELMAGAVRGAGEYLDTGVIKETWRHLWQYPHVNVTLQLSSTSSQDISIQDNNQNIP